MSACHTATKDTIPYSKPQPSAIVGWNELVRGKRNDAMFWHNRWREAGRPRDGWIVEMRRRTRARYHQAVREVKRQKEELVRTRVAESLTSKDSKLFWKNIAKIKRKTKSVSAVIDNEKEKDACNAFKRKYQKLFNSNPSPNLDEFKEKLSIAINSKCCKTIHDNSKNKHLHVINLPIIKDAISKLKYGLYIEDSYISIFHIISHLGCISMLHPGEPHVACVRRRPRAASALHQREPVLLGIATRGKRVTP